MTAPFGQSLAASPRPGAPPAGGPSPWLEPRADRLMKAVGGILIAYVWRVQDVVPVLGSLKLPLLLVAASFALYLSASHPWRQFALLRGRTLYLVFGILGVMTVGVSTSLWRSHSLNFVLTEYITNVVFMILVAASVRSVRDVEWFALVNLWGAILFATFVNLFFPVGDDGRLGNLVYYDANDFALVLVMTIPFAVYSLRPQCSARRRLLGVIALALFMIGIVKSGSRGGFLALLAVLLYVLLRYRAIPARLRLLAAIAGIGLLGLIGSTRYWTMMNTILHPQQDYNWSDRQGRREIWKRGLSYVEQRPLLGVGVGAFPVAEGKLSAIGQELFSRGVGFKWSVAHNSFVETAAELGVPGFLLFIALLGITISTMLRIRSGRRYGPLITKRETALGQMMVGALAGFVVGGFFVSAEYYSYLYFLIGLALGLDKVLRLRKRATMEVIAASVPTARLPISPHRGTAVVPRAT